VVTITVSEAGYVRGPDGHLDRSRDVITADIAALQDNKEAPVSSLPGKLVAGLLARRAADAGPISINDRHGTAPAPDWSRTSRRTSSASSGY
jgi:fructuronate reductase